MSHRSSVLALCLCLAIAAAYEAQRQARTQRGESDETLRQRYGVGVFDLRETLQQALSP